MEGKVRMKRLGLCSSFLMSSSRVLVRSSTRGCWVEQPTAAWDLCFYHNVDLRLGLHAGCRWLQSEAEALAHWNSPYRCRPEFVSAVQTFFEAVRRGEVVVIDKEGMERKIVLNSSGYLDLGE